MLFVPLGRSVVRTFALRTQIVINGMPNVFSHRPRTMLRLNRMDQLCNLRAARPRFRRVPKNGQTFRLGTVTIATWAVKETNNTRAFITVSSQKFGGVCTKDRLGRNSNIILMLFSPNRHFDIGFQDRANTGLDRRNIRMKRFRIEPLLS